MTYEEKVRWMRRYQDSLRRERELAAEVEQLHSRACKVTPSLTGMPGGPSDGQSLPRAVVNAYIDRQARKTGACLHCPWHTTGAACVLPRCFKPRGKEDK